MLPLLRPAKGEGTGSLLLWAGLSGGGAQAGGG
jgi:hypothetical protein